MERKRTGSPSQLELETPSQRLKLSPFPSEDQLPDLAASSDQAAHVQLASLDEQDIKLAQLDPQQPTPFPAEDSYSPLPQVELEDEQLEEDIVLDPEQDDFPTSLAALVRDSHSNSSATTSKTTRIQSEQQEEQEQDYMSSVSSKDSANDPARPRTEGIDPFTLKTVAQFYEHGGIFDDPEEEFFPHDTALNEKVIVWRGDITKLSVDAIVNAANRSLLGGGGVDGAIHSAAGRGLYQECKTLDGAETGESKITGGHRLPALHVIHTVGPIYSSSKKATCESQLRSCYQTTLELAVANNCKTLAFSGISTGIYGYPLDDATHVALDVVRTFLATDRGASLDKVIFTVFRQIDVDSYFNIVPSFFPPPPKANIDKDVENSTSTEVADKDGGGAEEPTPEASEAKSEEPANVEEGAGSESATIAKENEEELETGGIKETGLKSEEQEKRKPESKDDA